MAIGPGAIGRSIAGPLLQRASALGLSVADSGKSEPAKSIVPDSNCETPAPEPPRPLLTLTLAQAFSIVLVHWLIALACAVEPASVRFTDPDGHLIDGAAAL